MIIDYIRNKFANPAARIAYNNQQKDIFEYYRIELPEIIRIDKEKKIIYLRDPSSLRLAARIASRYNRGKIGSRYKTKLENIQ